MAHYVLEYLFVDDYLERRAGYRAEHLDLLNAALERGELLLAGALAEPVDRALLVWTDRVAAQQFSEADPYVVNGLVRSSSLRPWTVVVGEGAAPI